MPLALCTSMVLTLRSSCAAISLLLYPCETRRNTSVSRAVVAANSAPGALAFLGGKRRREMMGQRGIDVLLPAGSGANRSK